MTTPRQPPLALYLLFAIGLVLTGALRWAVQNIAGWEKYNAAPTLLFVALTVFVMFRVVHSSIGWSGIGLASRMPSPREFALGLAGAIAVVAVGIVIEPLLAQVFDESRDLARFDDAQTVTGLLTLLLFSWSFAAFGEELAFRGLLMRGISRAFGDTTGAMAAALVLQATVFGLVHAYQGPAGIIGSSVAGLIFGAVVLLGRRSLWPAIFAHGFANTFGLMSIYLS